MAWTEYQDDSKTFYHNSETNETTYICPPTLLQGKISSAISRKVRQEVGDEVRRRSTLQTFEGRQQQQKSLGEIDVLASPRLTNEGAFFSGKNQKVRSSSQPKQHGAQSKQQLQNQEQQKPLQEYYTVQIHPDSGSVYYQSPHSAVQSWTNPFTTSESVSAADMIAAAMSETKETDEGATAQEQLAGFNLVPSANHLRSEEAVSTTERLHKFVEEGKVAIGEEDAIKFKYPEYVDLFLPVEKGEREIISILLPKNLSSAMSKIVLRVFLTDTIGEVLNQTFEYFRKRNGGNTIDEGGTGRYVLKVCGFLDYMLHHDYKLGVHNYILECLRKKSKIELELVKLSPADQMDLGPILSQNMEDELEVERAKLLEHDDGWHSDKEERKKELKRMHRSKKCIFKGDIKWPFRVLVRGIEDCPGEELKLKSVFLEIGLYYCGALLGPTEGGNKSNPNSQDVPAMKTGSVGMCTTPCFPGTWLSSTKHEVAVLPNGTRVGFMLYGEQEVTHEIVPVAGVSLNLVDYKNTLLSGKMALKMWPHEKLQIARKPELAHPKCEELPHLVNVATGVVGENPANDGGTLHVVFDSYSTPVYGISNTLTDILNPQPSSKTGPKPTIQIQAKPSESEMKEIDRIANADPLYKLTLTDKLMIWNYRVHCSSRAPLLPKFLQSVNWGSVAAVKEAHRLLPLWKRFEEGSEVEYLEMLDIGYSDPVVREYIVRQLNGLKDWFFDQFLLQMVQVLKYEPYHDSPLSRMIIRRALQAPYKIGHNFYWLLRSEMHNADICPRYGCLLKTYIANCGPHRNILKKQCVVNDTIQVVAENVKKQPKPLRNKFAQDELKKVLKTFPSKFQICLSPRIECKGLRSEKCKVMSSKKMPIWLVFENSDPNGEPYLAIFKAGDDLRQDLMTLQLLRIMDSFWHKSGLDLRMIPYGCCATGHDLGMIEVVKNSDTTANIQVKYGGKNLGAWKDTPIDQYLKDQNKDDYYLKAVQNFVHTCAGYCVATYVLGIGDRHADNIMITNSGHLFHIDFGHFLGNFKSKFGYNRERAPFVFTPEMAYVMGNRETTFGFPDSLMKKKEPRIGFPEFEKMCCQAYNILRQRGALLMNLFILVTPAAMPELLNKNDVGYLRDMLSKELTDEAADKKFRQEIAKSLRTVSRRFDNWIHNMKHG